MNKKLLAISLAALVATGAFAQVFGPTAGPLQPVHSGGGGAGGTITAGTAPFAAYYSAATVISSNTALQFQATELVVNETGLSTMDFRVEGDTRANLLLVDASQDKIGINRQAGFIGATLDIDNGAVAESVFLLRDNGTAVLTVADGGPLTQEGGAVFNEAGSAVNFRVEGDTRSNLLLIDGTQDMVGINRATSTLGATLDIDNLAVAESIFIARDNGTAVFTVQNGGNVLGSGTASLWYLHGTGDNAFAADGTGTANVSTLSLGNTVSGANAQMNLYGSTAAGSTFGVTNASNAFFQSSLINGASMNFGTTNDNNDLVFLNGSGTNTQEKLRLKYGAGVIVNEAGGADVDFRVETDTVSNAFFIDASADSATFNVAVVATTHLITAMGIRYSLASPAYASTINLDFTAASLATVALTGDLTLTTSNLGSGRNYTLRIVADASVRTLTFPGTWVFVGAKPANIAASKTGTLSLISYSTTDANVVAAWAVEP